jgi:hypothetical protein
MVRRVALVRTDVSEELSAFFIRVIFLRSVRLLVRASVVPSSPILVALMKEALSSSRTSVLTRATWRNTPEDTILHLIKHQLFRNFNICSGIFHMKSNLRNIYYHLFGSLIVL